MVEPKWRTRPFKIVGYICIILFGSIGLVDLYLALDKHLVFLGIPNLPTISQYISHRSEDQATFGWIVIGIFVILGFHWFKGRIGKK